MREIKFRGQDKFTKQFVYGDLLQIINRVEISNESGDYEIIPETVGQYTGIKDKGEKEIFEGDIVHLESMAISNDEPLNGVVIFVEGAWWVDNKEEHRAEQLWGECNYLRIKGNIYENPGVLNFQ